MKNENSKRKTKNEKRKKRRNVKTAKAYAIYQ